MYFLKVADLVRERSKCLSRKIGSVLVKDGHIIATGYNGPASKVWHCNYRNDEGKYDKDFFSEECPRKRMGFKSGQGMEHCPAVHAEINTILQAAKFGVATKDSTLYCWCPLPCSDCTKEIINAGIKRVICTSDIESRPWALSSKEMFKYAGVDVDIITEDEINGKS